MARTEDGTAQPPSKRLRRDARARTPPPQAQPRNGGGGATTATACTSATQTAATAPPRRAAGGGCRHAGPLRGPSPAPPSVPVWYPEYSVMRRRPGDSSDGRFRVGDMMEWAVRRHQGAGTGVPVPGSEDGGFDQVEASGTMMRWVEPTTAFLTWDWEHSVMPRRPGGGGEERDLDQEEALCWGQPRPASDDGTPALPGPPSTWDWEHSVMPRRPDDSSSGMLDWTVRRDMCGEGEEAAAGVLGGVLDVFLVQPRDRGVPPPRLETLRRLPWRYWIDELRFSLALRFSKDADVPQSWSWESVMGNPAYGGQGACSIYAIATCIRAQHCLAFERRYGAGTFPYQLADVQMQYLIDACRAAGVLTANGGSSVHNVLKLMKDQDIWVRTQEIQGWERCNLRCSSFGLLNLKDSKNPSLLVAAFIRLQGPIIGSLDACDPDYLRTEYDDTYVYRGNRVNPSPVKHAVVCMDYRRTENGEIHIRILDNFKRKGPPRWIYFGAFLLFHFIEVEALDRAVVQHQHN